MSHEDRVIVSGNGASDSLSGSQAMPLDRSTDAPGIGSRRVPDLIGLGFHDAHARAAAARLRLSVTVWQTTVGPWGRVLDQRPRPDDPVRRGANIAITVSGRPHEQVPDVAGLPLDEAIERLIWLGFVPLIERRQASRSVSAGHVVSARPAAGARLVCGSVVALAVARNAQRKVASLVSVGPGVR